MNNQPTTNIQTADWEYDERRFEKEATQTYNLVPDINSLAKDGGSFIADGITDFLRESVNLAKDISGIHSESKPENKDAGKLAIGGKTEVNFNKAEAEKRTAQWKIEKMQIIEKEIDRAGDLKEVAREAFDEIMGMSSAQLAVEGDFNNKSITNKDILKSVSNRVWVFAKRVTALLLQKKEKTAVSMAETKSKSKSAMQGMFEGGSGSQGSGQANISFQAVG